jgi:hypothetical protein
MVTKLSKTLTKPKPLVRKPIDHSAVAKKLKSLGLYAGKTTGLLKKDKDKINRANKAFAFALAKPGEYKGLPLSPKQARAWKDRGITIHNGRGLFRTVGFDHIRKTRSGDVIMSDGEHSARLSLETDPRKLRRLSQKYADGQIGVAIEGKVISSTFNNFEQAQAYAVQLHEQLNRGRIARGDKPLSVLPVFISGESDDGS